jgi:predicted RNase H-like nuclease (RuvC/YqgF family)
LFYYSNGFSYIYFVIKIMIMDNLESKVKEIVQRYEENESQRNLNTQTYNPKIQDLYKKIRQLQDEMEAKDAPLSEDRKSIRLELASIDPTGKYHSVSFSPIELERADPVRVEKSAKLLPGYLEKVKNLGRRMDEDKFYQWVQENTPGITSDDEQKLWEEWSKGPYYIPGL